MTIIIMTVILLHKVSYKHTQTRRNPNSHPKEKQICYRTVKIMTRQTATTSAEIMWNSLNLFSLLYIMMAHYTR